MPTCTALVKVKWEEVRVGALGAVWHRLGPRFIGAPSSATWMWGEAGTGHRTRGSTVEVCTTPSEGMVIHGLLASAPGGDI